MTPRVAEIETTHLSAQNRTTWRVLAGGEVLHNDEVHGDPAGARSCELAHAWLEHDGLGIGTWTHAYDRTGSIIESPRGVEPRRSESAPAASREGWVKTTHVISEHRTHWQVVVNDEIVAKGDVLGDRSGASAYDAAIAWLSRAGIVAGGWTHALDRTRTAGMEPLQQIHGWLVCAAGPREAVALTSSQVLEMRAGGIPCPVCGTPCGPSLTESDDARRYAWSWNGSRWRARLHRSP